MIGSRETESARTTIFAPGKRALADEFLDAVFDQLLVAAIGKTARQFSADPKTRIDLAKEQGAAVAAEMAAGEIGHDFSSTKVLKKHRVVRHSVWRESGLLLSLTCFDLIPPLGHIKTRVPAGAVFSCWLLGFAAMAR